MNIVKDTTEERLREMVANIVNDIEQGIQAESDDDYDGQYEKGEIISGFDYLSDILDIEYYVNSQGECLGARILVAFGGPNIWIDTRFQRVEGYWWSDSFTDSYHDDVMGIGDAVNELWGIY